MKAIKIKKYITPLIFGLTSSAAMASAVNQDIPYNKVYKPTPESNFQSAWENGTAFNIRYGQTYIVDIYQLTGGTSGTVGRPGALNVKENVADPKTGIIAHPRRTDSSFLSRKQGPLHINATWDGLNIANEATTSYKSELKKLIDKYKTLNNDASSKRIDFYLPSSRFATASFASYAKTQLGIDNLRPDTFRTKSISGGWVLYEYCKDPQGKPINIRTCNLNGNNGTMADLFNIQYMYDVSGVTVCWHNYDRNENATMTVNGTAVNTASACVN